MQFCLFVLSEHFCIYWLLRQTIFTMFLVLIAVILCVSGTRHKTFIRDPMKGAPVVCVQVFALTVSTVHWEMLITQNSNQRTSEHLPQSAAQSPRQENKNQH